MSLLDGFSEDYVIMDKTTVPDGEGGFITQWTEGAKVSLSIAHDTSIEALRAEAEGVTSTYTFIFKKNINLSFPDVLKRLSDGQVFRVTSNARDKKTPNGAGLNLASVTAEKWVLV